MAIALYLGLTGSGKSYEIVRNQILPALKEGRVVYSNIPLQLDALNAYYPGSDIRPLFDDVIDIDAGSWPVFEPGALIVIDEAWNYWPSGQMAARVPVAQKDMFAMQRHCTNDKGLSQQIVLAVQSLDQLAGWLKGQIHTRYECECLDYAGKPSSYRIDVFQGKGRKIINQDYATYKPEIWCFYQSNSRGKTASGKKGEMQLDTRMNMLRRPLLKFGLPFCLIVVVFSVSQVFSYFGDLASTSKTGIVTKTEIKPVVTTTRVISASVPLADPASHGTQDGGGGLSGGVGGLISSTVVTQVDFTSVSQSYSSKWRITAYFKNEKTGKELVVAQGRAGLRYLDIADCDWKHRQLYCDVDGDIATVFTGQNSRGGIAIAPLELPGT